jgi:hypothetical protein
MIYHLDWLRRCTKLLSPAVPSFLINKLKASIIIINLRASSLLKLLTTRYLIKKNNITVKTSQNKGQKDIIFNGLAKKL